MKYFIEVKTKTGEYISKQISKESYDSLFGLHEAISDGWGEYLYINYPEEKGMLLIEMGSIELIELYKKNDNKGEE
jgi:hypothetical protein